MFVSFCFCVCIFVDIVVVVNVVVGGNVSLLVCVDVGGVMVRFIFKYCFLRLNKFMEVMVFVVDCWFLYFKKL